jgi:hypothetical protein
MTEAELTPAPLVVTTMGVEVGPTGVAVAKDVALVARVPLDAAAEDPGGTMAVDTGVSVADVELVGTLVALVAELEVTVQLGRVKVPL